MSQHYIFNEAGSIAGIPGTFANVRVDIADDGTQTVTPLATHPAFVPAPEETPVQAVQDEAVTAPEEVVQEAAKNTSKTKGV
jgi:hypothetical protein